MRKLYPSECRSSAYEIDYRAWWNRGYRGIIYDIDNTLVPHNAPADDKAKALFQSLRELGFDTCMVSNNKEPRVKTFCDEVGSKYVYKADKPSVKGYEKAMQKMHTTKEDTLFIGDQLFTDVWGANRTGLYSILTEPIHPKEEIQIVLKRILERIILAGYRRKKNLVLIGYMGSGKSTIGKAYAKKKGRTFLDTDAYIEAKEGRSISEIFSDEGETYFRKLEYDTIMELKHVFHDAVIATGGGLPISERNRAPLRQLGRIVYLKASKDTIYDRIKEDGNRPLLQVEEPRKEIQNMLQKREPIYESVSDQIIETDGRTVEEIIAYLK